MALSKEALGPGRAKFRAQALLPSILVLSSLILSPVLGRPQTAARTVTDQPAYDVEQIVKVRIFFPPGEPQPHALEIIGAVRYAGLEQAIFTGRVLAPSFTPTALHPATPYLVLWKIPDAAATGRYQVDLTVRDARSHNVLATVSRAASFAVHRKLARIERIELGRAFYTSGDPVSCRVVLKNLTAHPLTHLRVEFSDRYWPWIAGPAAQASSSIVPLSTDLTLAPGAERTLASPDAAVAPEVKEPSYHQYGVVVWDHARRNVLDIAFSPLAFVHPTGVDSPKPYPLQYVYPALKDVNVTAYRHFYPGSLDSAAIDLDHSRTMYTPGSTVPVRFSAGDPTSKAWRDVTVMARLLGPDGTELHRVTVTQAPLLAPGGQPIEGQAAFTLPEGKAGLYRVEVSISDSSGNALASNVLELGVNPLPKSILIFCAHEDDEGGWMPLIRAALENRIPVHQVYLTGGDAGSCDLYYEHSCGPAEALNFGALRMDETRAALGHLGLPLGNIDFLGLPDGGSGEIWYDHPASSRPYLSVLLASDHSPYDRLLRPNLPYARDAVVGALKELIEKFNPDVIVTAHPPSQGHIDHIVNGYFAIKALQELAREGAISPNKIEVLVDRVYDPNAAPYTPYHYADHVFYVSGEVAALAQEAGWFYQSQGGGRALGRIRDFNQFSREVDYRQILDWLEHAGWNETRAGSAGPSAGGE